MHNTHHKKIGQAKSNEGWMLTFADLLSLMLTFFVLVFSMSTIQAGSWGDVVETMRGQFNAARSAVTPKQYDTDESIARNGLRGLNVNYLRAIVESSLANNENLQGVSIARDGSRVVISVPANGLFADKDGVFQEGAVSAVAQLAGSFVQIKNRLAIAAHTNNQPVLNGKFRSNWELSVTRAQLVAGVFADSGYQQAITVVGYGASKFDSAGSRATIDELEKQERIDFVLLGEGVDRGPLDVF